MTPACWAGVRVAQSVLKCPGPVKSGPWTSLRYGSTRVFGSGCWLFIHTLAAWQGSPVLASLAAVRTWALGGDAARGDADGTGLRRFGGQGRQLTGGCRRGRRRGLLLVRRTAHESQRQECTEQRGVLEVPAHAAQSMQHVGLLKRPAPG